MAAGPPTTYDPHRPGRIERLDGLRGLAIVSVLVWHLFVCVPGPEGSAIATLLKQIFGVTWSGVDLFFVLSGFLIGGTLLDYKGRANYFKVFYGRRFVRIVPLYALLVVTFLVTRALVLPTTAPGLLRLLGDGSDSAWPLALFVQNVRMAMTGTFGPHWLGVTWSLCIEGQFYLVLPPLVYAAPRRRVLAYVVALALAAPLFRFVAGMVAPGLPLARFTLLPARMDGLLFGALLAFVVRSAALRGLLAKGSGALKAVTGMGGLLVLAFALGKVGFLSGLMSTLGYSVLALWYTALLVVCLFRSSRLLDYTFHLSPLRWLGRVSYFVYLAHQLFCGLVHHWVRARPPEHHDALGWACTALSILLTMGGAALSWSLVERRLVAVGHRWRYGAAPTPPDHPTPSEGASATTQP